MDNDKLLEKIGELIDDRLKPVKDQLNTLELKVETVNQRVEQVHLRVEQVNQRVEQVHLRVEQSQQETIESLSDLIHAGYELHEKRIKALEEQTSIS